MTQSGFNRQSVYTILLKTTDTDLETATARTLSELGGYRVIYCRDDLSASRRLDDVDVHLFLYHFDGASNPADNPLVTSRTSHPHCARVLIVAPEAQAVRKQLCQRAVGQAGATACRV